MARWPAGDRNGIDVVAAAKIGDVFVANGDLIEVSLKWIDGYNDFERNCKAVGIDNNNRIFLARVVNCADYNQIELDLSEKFFAKRLTVNYCYISSVKQATLNPEAKVDKAFLDSLGKELEARADADRN